MGSAGRDLSEDLRELKERFTRCKTEYAAELKAAEEKGRTAAENLHGMYRAKMFDLRKDAALRVLNQAAWFAEDHADKLVVEEWIKEYCKRNRITL